MLSDNYPPYNFVDEEGRLLGFNVDILEAINRIYDNQLIIEPGDWSMVNQSLVHNEVGAVGGVHDFDYMDSDFFLTRSVINTFHCFFYNEKFKNDFRAQDIRTAQSPLVVLWENDVLIHYILSLNPNARFVFVRSYEELLDELDRKEVCCAIAQKIICLHHAQKLNKSYIFASDKVFLERQMGFKVSKNYGELAELLNNGLEIIMSNGEYQKIYNKWIAPYNRSSNNWHNYLKYIIIIGGLVVLVFSVLLIFNQMLKSRVRKQTRDLQNQLELNSKIRFELEDQKIKAEVSDQMKSAFLANMSHEIRTPMNGILGFTELLKSNNNDLKERDYFISLIQQSGDRMLSTINNIIDISKIESGAERLTIKSVDLRLLIADLYDFFKFEASENKIELVVNEEEFKASEAFYSDEYKLNSILSNLIKNAIKFTHEGSVTVIYSYVKSSVDICVSDTGIGIRAEKQDIIFDHFVRADISYSSEYEGSGLGLSISKEYVNMLGGTIRLESSPGEGSKFFIRLPNLNANKK